jgi:Cu+-exporting ATPase
LNQVVALAVEGMTCSTCAARIEGRLNQMPGVKASVRLWTETAWVELPPGVTTEQVIAEIEAIGYGARLQSTQSEAQRATQVTCNTVLAAWRDRLVVCAMLSVPMIAVSLISALRFPHWQWATLALSTPVVVWGAWPFYRNALEQLRHRAATVDTLAFVGIAASYLWSVYVLLFSVHPASSGGSIPFLPSSFPEKDIYFDVAVAITVIMLAGHYVELRACQRARASLPPGITLESTHVTILRDQVAQAVPVADLQVGDHLIVELGERIAADGVLIQGVGSIDASLLTGECHPVVVHVGDDIGGGAVNIGPRLVIEATRVGQDTQLARLLRCIEETQSSKGPLQRRADRVAARFTPLVLVGAGVTLVAWLMTGHTGSASVSAAVALLVVACPSAIGLATPLALMIGTARGAQLGIIIKEPKAMVSIGEIDTVILDKSGTVTTGHTNITGLHPADGQTVEGFLRLATALSGQSHNPLAQAIFHEAQSRDIALPPVDRVVTRYNDGLVGRIEGRQVYGGRVPWVVAQADEPVSGDMADRFDAAAAHGRATVGFVWDNRFQGLVEIGDPLRESSPAAVAEFKRLGMEPILMSGDNETATRYIADQVGIRKVVADVVAADQVELIRALQAQGHVVAMVGDGANDAAALAQADLGVALGSGASIALEASDITVVRGDLRAAVDSVRLSRRILACVHGNLIWAFAYNCAAIPLAVTGVLTPMLCSVAMLASWVFVAVNSLRLLAFRPMAKEPTSLGRNTAGGSSLGPTRVILATTPA